MVFKAAACHLVCFIAFAIIPIAAAAQDKHPVQDNSCRRFAQDFYSWYVPFTQKRLRGPASDFALQREPGVFASALFRALKADSDAQRHAQGEIVGIDFDPFVGSQDPADQYDLRKITQKGDSCFVEVWRNSQDDDSEKSAKPDVIAELSRRTGRWQFENFRYPDLNADLMGVLASLRKERGEQQ